LITVDRTNEVEVGPTSEQIVPINLTDENGDSIPGLPSSFTLRIAPGARSTTGTIPLPNGLPEEVDAIARIERADQTRQFEVVEFSDTPWPGNGQVTNQSQSTIWVWNSEPSPNGTWMRCHPGETTPDNNDVDYIYMAGKFFKVPGGRTVYVTEDDGYGILPGGGPSVGNGVGGLSPLPEIDPVGEGTGIDPVSGVWIHPPVPR